MGFDVSVRRSSAVQVGLAPSGQHLHGSLGVTDLPGAAATAAGQKALNILKQHPHVSTSHFPFLCEQVAPTHPPLITLCLAAHIDLRLFGCGLK